MFGMGFSEILIIAVIAILFLGPDKLPSTMIEIAKFFRSVKNTVGSVKQSIEEEMHVADIKEEALAYKKELLSATTTINKMGDIDSLINDEIDKTVQPQQPKQQPQTQTPQPTQELAQEKTQEVTFKKKKKKVEEEKTDV
jgi:sec-independent protein translocase protein TatB